VGEEGGPRPARADDRAAARARRGAGGAAHDGGELRRARQPTGSQRCCGRCCRRVELGQAGEGVSQVVTRPRRRKIATLRFPTSSRFSPAAPGNLCAVLVSVPRFGAAFFLLFPTMRRHGRAEL
jgi:hypothetical protein